MHETHAISIESLNKLVPLAPLTSKKLVKSKDEVRFTFFWSLKDFV